MGKKNKKGGGVRENIIRRTLSGEHLEVKAAQSHNCFKEGCNIAGVNRRNVSVWAIV